MITLKKDGKTMSVKSETQAFVFERSGYVRVGEEAPKEAKTGTPVGHDSKPAEKAPEEKPRRRRSSRKAE